jgi:diaminopimelate decarboxylase
LIDVGGGLGIAYTIDDQPLGLYDWAKGMSAAVEAAFKKRLLPMPRLLLEPGRSIVGPAGVTLYTAGDVKPLPDGGSYVALDGGMADNPRPATYNAVYTAVIASRMDAPPSDTTTTLVGKYCESGDIIIKDAGISAETGDIIAVFATGAYNYSMASNYNRTARPACVLVDDGFAEVIVERETCDDLLRQDRVPGWLLKD